MNDDKPTYAVKGGSMSADGNSTFVNLLASGEGHGLRRDIGRRAIETMERVGIRQAGLVCSAWRGSPSMPNATRCQLPPESRLHDYLPRIDYLESFEVPSRSGEQNLVATYAATLGRLPKAFK